MIEKTSRIARLLCMLAIAVAGACTSSKGPGHTPVNGGLGAGAQAVAGGASGGIDAGRVGVARSGSGASGAGAAGAAAGNLGRAGVSGTAGVPPRAGTGGGVSSPADAAVIGNDAGRSDAGVTCERYDSANPPRALTLSGDLGTHDPSAIAADGRYYVFQTGRGIPTKTSSDLMTWRAGPSVFSSNPAWIAQQVSGATDLWAPDISFFGGVYHLYYAASTFGSNHSCIGHATRASLSSGSWSDQGAVICSNPPGQSDNWNAIDPNAAVDDSGTPWLAFGSFWSGLKLVKLDSTGKRADNELHAIATRTTANGAIEAPYIIHHCGHYYLFASFDVCCKGVDSTYNIRVGRSDTITGPYQDRAGTAMLQGGGTLVLQGDMRWHGPGHNAVLLTDHGAYDIYHSYDANNNGQSFLRISELVWDDTGWPVSGGP